MSVTVSVRCASSCSCVVFVGEAHVVAKLRFGPYKLQTFSCVLVHAVQWHHVL